jgi:hypothetical protein
MTARKLKVAPPAAGHNLPPLPFADEIVELFEWHEANKPRLARWEKLKLATKQLAGVGNAMAWKHGDYLIEIVLVPKAGTGLCMGCPGQPTNSVQQHFKPRRMVAAS